MNCFHRFVMNVALAAASVIFSFYAAAFAQDAVVTVDRVVENDSVQGDEPFDVSTGAFTVAVRAKLLAQGTEEGNGDDNAMVWNVSNGWSSGMRLIYHWNNYRYAFQIGAEGGNRGVWTTRRFYPGVMRDLVATYDAETKLMQLFVDGELAATTEFDGELTTEGRPLNVGFGNSGVGSSRMFVESAETWTRALDVEEIRARNAARPEEERAQLDALRDLEDFSSASVRPDVDVDACLLLLENPDLPDTLRWRLRGVLTDALAEREYVVDRTLDTTLYDQFAELVFSTADEALSGRDADSSDASVVTKDELEKWGRLRYGLTRLRDVSVASGKTLRTILNSSSFNREHNRVFQEQGRETLKTFEANGVRAAAALKNLDANFPREKDVFAKVAKLEESAERVRRIEREALGMQMALAGKLRQDKNTRVLVVAPNGSDSRGTGSEDAPFATLARAFEEVQTSARQNAGDAATKTVITVKPGVYYITSPAQLSGVANVWVSGAKDGTTKFTGSRPVGLFLPLNEYAEKNANVAAIRDRLQEEVRDKVYAADLNAAGIDDVGTLKNRGYHEGDRVKTIPTFTLNGEAQTLARWPNEGEELLAFGDKLENAPGAPEDSSTFHYDFDRPDGWKLDGDSDDIWAFGLFQWEWAANFRRVLGIDRDAKTVTFDYRDGSGRFSYYFVNVLEELDAPGEYYVDRDSSILYFYPPEGIDSAEALNAAHAEYDVYEGRFVELEDVSDVLVSNVTFSGGRETAVTMKNCRRASVSDCVIEQMGGNGVVVNGGEYCSVVGTRMRSLGACGVRMTGGDFETLKPCRHLVHNNYVSGFSRIDRVYAPAVSAVGVGFAITNNLFCDSPHHAMRTDGCDIYVARNEVHSVVLEYSDQAGIDIYCDPSYRGIVIERNLWRHIGSSFALCGQAGIRLDDSISGVIMKDNVFYRSSGGQFGGIQIHGGKDNLVVGNAFVDCKQALSFSPWGGDRYEKFVTERFPGHVENELYKLAYPFFDEIFDHYDRNYVFNNKAINCDVFNRNGDNTNIFVGNIRKTEVPDLAKLGVHDDHAPEVVFYFNEKALKKWLATVSGVSLSDVGLKANWNGAGESVSPYYIGDAGNAENR